MDLEPPYLRYQEADPVMKDRTATPSKALHPVDNVHPVSPSTAAEIGPRRSDDWYTTAARAAHNDHCTACRELSAASDAAAAANGASMQRRDRRQLGLRFSRRAQEVDA